MIFSVNSEAFREAMATAGRVIPKKSPWPILLNVKMIVDETSVLVIGSNADVTFETRLPAEVDTPGTVCTPFAELSKFCSAIKSTEIKFAIANDKAKISAGRNRLTLLCGNADDYPNYRAAEGEMFSVDGPTLCRAMRFCLAAASDDEMRYHISGVNFDEEEEDLNIWGTNAQIASRAILSGIRTIGGGATMPFDAAQIVLSVAAKAETVSINVNERGWSAEIGQTRIWGKVIAERYPDMRRMLDQFAEFTDAATIEMTDIQHGLSVGVIGSSTLSDKSNKIILKSLDENTMIFRGGDPTGGVGTPGRAEVDADIKCDFGIALNSRYLGAALTGVETDSRLTIRIAGENGMQFEPSQSSAVARMTSVIMPIRVSEKELADV